MKVFIQKEKESDEKRIGFRLEQDGNKIDLVDSNSFYLLHITVGGNNKIVLEKYSNIPKEDYITESDGTVLVRTAL